MAKTIGRLTATTVDSGELKPGLHSDGANLYLRVSKDGNRSWMLIYRFRGRQREAGLGKAIGKAGAGKTGVSLAEARSKAQEGRAYLNSKPKVDPLTVWREMPETDAKTFAHVAEEYIALNTARWRSAKHATQWRTTIAKYCKPLMKVPVDQIDGQMVRQTLTPIWTKIPETASRLRGRIETVIDFGRDVNDLRPNPARGLAKKLPNLGELGKIDRKTGEQVERSNHPAMPYTDVPTFAARLRADASVTARALETVLLTACRTNEVLGAKWSEFDLSAKTWTIPVARLKNRKQVRKPHIVPLSDRMLAILAEMNAVRLSDYVFPGRLDNHPLGEMALLHLMHGRMRRPDCSVHGLRSSFRDYAGDEANAPWEVCEHALGHLVGSKVTRSYRRGDAFDKRRELMEMWSRYCESSPGDAAGNVIPFETRSARAS